MPPIVQQLWEWYGTSDSQYSSSGKGMEDSNGWILTQSKFNVVEVACQLLFLFYFPRDSAKGFLSILFASICTLWKTLIYMSMIYHSQDPVLMVPGLKCLGFSAVGNEHEAAVQAALNTDSWLVHLFKFQFNFWWIIMPFIVTKICFSRITQAFEEKKWMLFKWWASKTITSILKWWALMLKLVFEIWDFNTYSRKNEIYLLV